MNEFTDIAALDVNERYVFTEKISSGGYGEVWIAQDQVLKQRVAIKKLYSWNLVRPEAMDILRTEVYAGRRINSPHVLKIYDLIKINGQDCLVMEYIEGWTLQALLKEKPSPIALMQVLRDLCQGLSAIHDAGFAHRDLRPDNILIDHNGKLVIIDLGLAGVVEERYPRSQHSYRAPELEDNLSYILSDIYSLGGVLAFIAGGANHAAPRPSEAWLAPIISKCQATNPDNRYPSVKVVLKEIEYAYLQFQKAKYRPRITLKRFVLWGAAMLATASLFAFRPHKKGIQVSATGPFIVMPASDDTSSQMFADLITSYLEAQHRTVFRPVRWIDVKKRSLETNTHFQPSVISVSYQSSQAIPSIRLKLEGQENAFTEEILLSSSNLSALAVLSKLAATLKLQPPDRRFDFSLDGYSIERFAAIWQRALAGEDISDPKTCEAGQSFPVLLLRATVNVRVFSTIKTDSAYQCATASITSLKSTGLKTSQVALISAKLLQSENSNAEGVRVLQSAAEKLPSPSPIYRKLSEIAFQGGFVPEALNLAAQAIKADPGAAQNYLTAAKVHMAQGSDEKAVQLLQVAISLDPYSNAAYTSLGALYIRIGKFEEAKATLERAIEIKSTPETNLVLGLANLLCGHSKQGLLILSGAVAANPNLHSMATLGAAFRWVGDAENAKITLRNALKLGNGTSTDATELGWLAIVHAQLNQTKAADQIILRAAKYRSLLETELLYDSLIVDAFAGRRDDCIRKFQTLKERHFPIAFITKDPQILKILQSSN